MNQDINTSLLEFGGSPVIVQMSGNALRHVKASAFQRITQSATAEHLSGDPYHYVAFQKGEARQGRLEIRPMLQAWRMPGYRYLMDLVYNPPEHTELVLIYSFMLVKVAGRHMEPIVEAIAEGTCAFIQQYHENEFTPPQEGTPVITDIAFVLERE